MKSFILFIAGKYDDKFDISFFSVSIEEKYRSLLRIIFTPKKYLLIHFLWNWNKEWKIEEVTE